MYELCGAPDDPSRKATRSSGRSAGADAMLNSRRVPRASGCRCGTSSSRYWPGTKKSRLCARKVSSRTVGVRSARDSSVSRTAVRTRERERHGVADEERALLAEADRAEVDRPAGEHADDGGDGELLPAPRRQGQRLRQHERAEEEERRRPQDRARGSAARRPRARRLVLRRRCAARRRPPRSRGRPRPCGSSRCATARRGRARSRGRRAPACRPTTTTSPSAGTAMLRSVSAVAPIAAGLKMWRPCQASTYFESEATAAAIAMPPSATRLERRAAARRAGSAR